MILLMVLLAFDALGIYNSPTHPDTTFGRDTAQDNCAFRFYLSIWNHTALLHMPTIDCIHLQTRSPPPSARKPIGRLPNSFPASEDIFLISDYW